MVTFNCEICNDTVPKKNTEKHYYRCPEAVYTCIDCSQTFADGVSYKKHTQCISEDEKYQKALYKGKNKQQKKQQQQQPQPHPKKEEPKKEEPKKEEPKKEEPKLIKLTNGESLYKILKKIKSKDEKKKLLKSLIAKDNTLFLENK